MESCLDRGRIHLHVLPLERSANTPSRAATDRAVVARHCTRRAARPSSLLVLTKDQSRPPSLDEVVTTERRAEAPAPVRLLFAPHNPRSPRFTPTAGVLRDPLRDQSDGTARYCWSAALGVEPVRVPTVFGHSVLITGSEVCDRQTVDAVHFFGRTQFGDGALAGS
jgi:hypothetical protein